MEETKGGETDKGEGEIDKIRARESVENREKKRGWFRIARENERLKGKCRGKEGGKEFERRKRGSNRNRTDTNALAATGSENPILNINNQHREGELQKP